MYAKPSLTATAPNQIWTWDITKLATMQKGVFLMAYVIIDLFSRYVVGWMLAAKECQHLAAQLFAETIARHGIEPGLQVHMDREPRALHPPADVFFGRVADVAAVRQLALDIAYAAHPERFPHGAPRVALPPDAVSINPLTADALQPLPAAFATDDATAPTGRSQGLAALRRLHLDG